MSREPLSDFAATAHRSYAEAVEARVRADVGLVIRGSIRVRIERPRWMPDRLYRYLMRTIVVEETAATADIEPSR